jgi:transglutaminase-like putative cysteine protease
LEADQPPLLTAKTPRVRTFRLDYHVTIRGPGPLAKVRVWLPEPPTTDAQSVAIISREFPGSVSVHTEPTYGNRMLYFEADMPASGVLTCGSSYRVQRREVLGLPGEQPRNETPLSAEERRLHLAPNRRIPLDGKSQRLLDNIPLPAEQLALARLLYDRVDGWVRYDKSQPGYGFGDSEWVCDSRYGNCTDFHSLFIAWARARQLPARFEIGFPLPNERGQGVVAGYHCWAFFHVDGHGWVPVDISEADKNPGMKDYYFGHLTENRITFTQGRDIQLVPAQAGPPLNFFIFPYVEVNGSPLRPGQAELTATFLDEGEE